MGSCVGTAKNCLTKLPVPLLPKPIDALHVSRAEVDDVTKRESQELKRRAHLYRDSRPYPKLEGRTVILIDGGMATGASMIVAVNALRQKFPTKIVVAVPVAPPTHARRSVRTPT